MKLNLWCAVGAVVVTVAVLFFLQRARSAEAVQLRESNASMRQAAFERQRAKTTNASSANRSAGAPNSVRSNRAINNPPASGNDAEAGSNDYRFDGQDTSTAALQTFAWACDHADVATMEKLITFEPRAFEKASAYFASLPAEAHCQAPTVNALAATLLVNEGMQHPLPHAGLLAKATTETISDDLVRTRLPGTTRDGDLYRRIGTVWKFVITEKSVDDYLSRRPQK